MSAKKRGYQNMAVAGMNPNAELPNDYYATPPQICEMAYKIMQAFASLGRFGANGGSINAIDIGAGTGIWGSELYRFSAIHPMFPNISRLDGLEIDKAFPHPVGYSNWYQNDLRDDPDWYTKTKYDLVIGNPPYGRTNGKVDRLLTEKAIRRGWQLLAPNGYMVMLLKTVFVEGIGRGDNLFKEIRPNRIMISSKRIPFRPETKGKKTNTVSYALYYWRRGEQFDNTSAAATLLGWFNWETGGYQL